jgi:hypothetical protein
LTSCRVRLLIILQRQRVSSAAFDRCGAQTSTLQCLKSCSVRQLQRSTAVEFDSGRLRQLQIGSAIASSAVAFGSRSIRQRQKGSAAAGLDSCSIRQLQRLSAGAFFSGGVRRHLTAWQRFAAAAFCSYGVVQPSRLSAVALDSYSIRHLQQSPTAADWFSGSEVESQRLTVAAFDNCRVRLLIILQRQRVSAAAFDSCRAQPLIATVSFRFRQLQCLAATFFDSRGVAQAQRLMAAAFSSGGVRQSRH